MSLAEDPGFLLAPKLNMPCLRAFEDWLAPLLSWLQRAIPQEPRLWSREDARDILRLASSVCGKVLVSPML